MSTITVREIQQDPEGFLRRVEAGEAFLVVNGQRTLAEVRPVSGSPVAPRPYGLCAGQFSVPADFNLPLPESELEEFEGA